MTDKDYLTAAAKAAAEQLAEDAALHVPLGQCPQRFPATDILLPYCYPDFEKKEGVYVLFFHINS